MDKDVENDTPKCKKLKSSIKHATKALKQEREKYNRLHKKMYGSHIVNVDKFPFKSDTSKILTLMQFKKKKKEWSEDEKKFCLALYYKSPSAYKHLLKSGVVLAAPSTIQYWLQDTNCFPGVNKNVFENIAQKFSGKTIKERACTICFDEIAIMSSLEFTKTYDLIEGFEDFGDHERTNVNAKYALVFIVKGVYTNWKMPLAYFLPGRTTSAEKLKDLIKKI